MAQQSYIRTHLGVLYSYFFCDSGSLGKSALMLDGVQSYLRIKNLHTKYTSAAMSKRSKSPKIARPTMRPMFSGAFGGGVGVGVGVGMDVGEGEDVGKGVTVGVVVSEGVGVGEAVLEAVRFNTRLSPVSHVPVSIAS